jgi:hypothetical protein
MLMKVYECDDFSEYLDYKTIKLTDDFDIYLVEEIVDFVNPKKLSSNKLYCSIRVSAKYNLEKKQRKSLLKLACSDPMGGGTVLLHDDTKHDWEDITPDSNAEKKLQLLMRNKGNKKKEG